MAPTTTNSTSASPTPPTPTIAIIGAGIGGLALAISLTHLRIPYTIYESSPAFSALGAGVGLGPNALRAMDLIDPRFRAQYMKIATGNLDPGKRHVMMEAWLLEEGLGAEKWEGDNEGENGWLAGGKGWGGRGFERTGAHRRDLLEVMTRFIPQETVRFGKKVNGIRQDIPKGKVFLEFGDGEVAAHVAVIGADGVKGMTRGVVLGERWPEHVEPKYTGEYIYRTIVPMDKAMRVLGRNMAGDAKMFFGRGANIATYPISMGRECNVVAFKRDKEAWRNPDFKYDVSREHMLKDYEKISTDGRLLQLLSYANPTRWGIFHHPTTPTYFNSLVCLLGDVAHAGGPHQAAGAGQCLEDSLVLSKVLGRLYSTTPQAILSNTKQLGPRLLAAFTAYDEIRRPRAQKQVRTTEECGMLYSLQDPECGEDMVKVLRNLTGRFTWIWEHDLEGDVRKCQERYDELVAETELKGVDK